MNLAEIEASLPWGFHDAYLERLEIDWVQSRLAFELRLMMTESQDKDQRARLTVNGLVYCSVEPPIVDPPAYEATSPDGLWIDAGDGAAADAVGLPATPPGCFVHHLLVSNWNYRSIHICGTAADLTWLEPEPVASRAGTRALFPGDEVPDAVVTAKATPADNNHR
jgi:hypothetical protein